MSIKTFKCKILLFLAGSCIFGSALLATSSAYAASDKPLSCSRKPPEGLVFKGVFPMSGAQIDEMLREDALVQAKLISKKSDVWQYSVRSGAGQNKQRYIEIAARYMSAHKNTAWNLINALTADRVGFSLLVIKSMQQDYFAEEQEIVPITGKQLCALLNNPKQTVKKTASNGDEYLQHRATREMVVLNTHNRQLLQSGQTVPESFLKKMMTQFFGMRITVANAYIRKTLDLK